MLSRMLARSRKSRYARALQTNPGGTGTPLRVSSPRFAPLPPADGTSSFVMSSNHRMMSDMRGL